MAGSGFLILPTLYFHHPILQLAEALNGDLPRSHSPPIKSRLRTEEMAQQLEALAAKSTDHLSSVPETYVEGHSQCCPLTNARALPLPQNNMKVVLPGFSGILPSTPCVLKPMEDVVHKL